MEQGRKPILAVFAESKDDDGCGNKDSAPSLGLPTVDGSGDASAFGDGGGDGGGTLSLGLPTVDGSGDACAVGDGGGGALSLGLPTVDGSGDACVVGDGGGGGGSGTLPLPARLAFSSVSDDSEVAVCVAVTVNIDISGPSTETRRNAGAFECGSVRVIIVSCEPRSIPTKTANARVHR